MTSLLASMNRSKVEMKPEVEAEKHDEETPEAVSESASKSEPEVEVENPSSMKAYMELFCSNQRSELPEIDVHTGRAPKLSKILLDYSNTCMIKYVCDCAEVTMSSFINAVLRDHFKRHKKVLRKLHRREINFSAL